MGIMTGLSEAVGWSAGHGGLVVCSPSVVIGRTKSQVIATSGQHSLWNSRDDSASRSWAQPALAAAPPWGSEGQVFLHGLTLGARQDTSAGLGRGRCVSGSSLDWSRRLPPLLPPAPARLRSRACREEGVWLSQGTLLQDPVSGNQAGWRSGPLAEGTAQLAGKCVSAVGTAARLARRGATAVSAGLTLRPQMFWEEQGCPRLWDLV